MRSLFIALLLALPAVALAQANYQEGYIVKNNGDTIKGYINYQEWAYSPQKVEFKTNRTDNQPQDCNPGNIKGFGVKGAETYASFVGLISMNKNIFPDVPSNLDTTRKQGAIFLKQLDSGDRLTLYYNSEIHKNRFFIAEKGQPPVELKYYEYYDQSNTEVVFRNLYRGQLLLYAYKFSSGDQNLKNKIEQAKFEQPDLEEIVDEINGTGILKEGSTSTHKAEKSPTRLFGGVGLNSISTTYYYSGLVTTTTTGGQTMVSASFGSRNSSTQALKFDFGMDVFINPDIQQFVFRTELSFSSFSGHFSLPATATTSIAGSDLSFTESSLTVTPQFLFSVYNKDKVKVYIDAGFGLNRSSFSNNSDGTGESASGGYMFRAYFPIEAGIILNKRFDISFTYASFTTSWDYSAAAVFNKLSTTLGVKVFLN